MKTQIIQLEPHDDVISIRDKMSWGQTSRLLLVWPSKGRVLHRKLDLVLLLRQSFTLGAQLALVTSDDEIRHEASVLQIPTFTSTKAALSSRWRTSRWRRSRSFRRTPKPDLTQVREQAHPDMKRWEQSPVIRAITFGISLVSVLSLILMILPSAQIKLQPEIKGQSIQTPVKAGINIRSVTLAGELPAHLTTIQVEGRKTIPSTGITSVPFKAAEGIVKFTNLTDQEVEIPAGTVVSTLGSDVVRFQTTRASKVLARPGNAILVPIKAIAWGALGNQPSNTIQAIEGPLGLKLSVTNSSATTKGADTPVPASTQADQDRLYDQLQRDLLNSAANELMRTYSSQPEQRDYPIITSIRFARVLEKNYVPEVGEPAEELELSLRLEFEAMVVSSDDVQNYVIQLLDGNLPENFFPLPGTQTVKHTTVPLLDDGGYAHWTIEGKREITAQINPLDILERLRGRRTDKIANLLAGLPLKPQIEAHLFPAWWPIFPFLTLRIELQGLVNSSETVIPK